LRCLRIAALLKQQHGDDMKAVTHEVSDCQTKLETAKAYVTVLVVHSYCNWFSLLKFLHCFDIVGWMTGRASDL